MLNLGDGRETPTHYNNVEIKAQENEISPWSLINGGV